MERPPPVAPVEWFVLSLITDRTGNNDDGVCCLVFFALDDADANVDFDRLADASTAPAAVLHFLTAALPFFFPEDDVLVVVEHFFFFAAALAATFFSACSISKLLFVLRLTHLDHPVDILQ